MLSPLRSALSMHAIFEDSKHCSPSQIMKIFMDAITSKTSIVPSLFKSPGIKQLF